MKNILRILALFLVVTIIASCSKKTTGTTSRSVYGSGSNADTASASTTPAKPVRTKPIKTPTPKVIVVNDNSASKTFDGRLYYDLDGKRYWRNYKDGKYYLFNKSMATDPDFKKP